MASVACLLLQTSSGGFHFQLPKSLIVDTQFSIEVPHGERYQDLHVSAHPTAATVRVRMATGCYAVLHLCAQTLKIHCVPPGDADHRLVQAARVQQVSVA
jgi:hypothetical protein